MKTLTSYQITEAILYYVNSNQYERDLADEILQIVLTRITTEEWANIFYNIHDNTKAIEKTWTLILDYISDESPTIKQLIERLEKDQSMTTVLEIYNKQFK